MRECILIFLCSLHNRYPPIEMKFSPNFHIYASYVMTPSPHSWHFKLRPPKDSQSQKVTPNYVLPLSAEQDIQIAQIQTDGCSRTRQGRASHGGASMEGTIPLTATPSLTHRKTKNGIRWQPNSRPADVARNAHSTALC